VSPFAILNTGIYVTELDGKSLNFVSIADVEALNGDGVHFIDLGRLALLGAEGQFDP